MEEPKAINKKLRLQLYDNNFNQLSDRLVGQELELDKGPKETHKGPMKIEVCLFEQADITAFIGYLARIQGSLPIVSNTKKIKNNAISKDEEGWREKLVDKLTDMMQEQDIKSQENLMYFLRKEGFIFLTWDTLPQYPKFADDDDTQENRAMLEGYQWMIPLTREAKNPLNNKYDPYLMYGFKLLGKKNRKVMLMQNLETVTEIQLPWEVKGDDHFKKTEMAKFPTYMVLEEREKFRIELYKYRKEPDNWEFSKFFKRWAKDVDFREKEELQGKGLLEK